MRIAPEVPFIYTILSFLWLGRRETAPVAQWIEQSRPKGKMEVRFLSGAHDLENLPNEMRFDFLNRFAGQAKRRRSTLFGYISPGGGMANARASRAREATHESSTLSPGTNIRYFHNALFLNHFHLSQLLLNQFAIPYSQLSITDARWRKIDKIVLIFLIY